MSGRSTDDGISSSLYAQKSQRLMQLASNLRSLGAQDVLDLPRISVIGGQSTGKSSLVEAITGVRVPRDINTCTRCPMECSMFSTSGAWSCKISLRFHYNIDGSLSRPIRNVIFGPSLSDKSEVELVLRRAQAAILNPAIPPETFLHKSVDELKYYSENEAFASGTLKFSKNVVCVDIRDPESADLSFVDLPGLIQNETRDTIKFVEDLVHLHITGDSLILVAIPMNDDMENQGAMRIAREADSSKSRTIGVLTKPDTLKPGATSAREKWKDVIEGRSPHKLQHGYYCVRLADEDERNMNLGRLETQERSRIFFANTIPWSTFSDRSRLGIPALVADLSTLFINIIDRSLPKLRNKAQEKIDECRIRLAEMPPAMKNDPTAEVIGMITGFCQELQVTVHGNGDAKAFIQQNRASYGIFKRKIRSTAPDFRPFQNGDEYNPPFKRYDAEDLDESVNPAVKPQDLYDVRRVIQGSIAWELPHNVPFDAKGSLINGFTNLWDAPAIECYDAVYARLETLVQNAIQQHFKRFPNLRAHISTFIMDELQLQKAHGLSALKSTLRLEKAPLFTQNLHYLDAVRVKWLSRYKEARRNASSYRKPIVSMQQNGVQRNYSPSPSRTQTPEADTALDECCQGEDVDYPYPRCETRPEPPSISTLQDRALRALGELGYPGLSVADLARLCPPDAFEEELIVMADVRAYFQVAYKRIIDYVPLTIEHSLNQALATTLQNSLWQKLDFGSSDASRRLNHLLAEDPAVAAKRDEWETKLNRLEQVQQELSSFGI